MKTVKQVSELTGVSIRTLQYYDEIGLLKPTKKTVVGYRLYDEKAISKLQQILFFKELGFKLKNIKAIMNNPNFDKIEAYRQQKKLLQIKSDRINKLIKLLEKLEKGEKNMEFKEFDLSNYFEALEQFKINNKDEIVKSWGSVEAFDNFIKVGKQRETRIAKTAIESYGSIEKYTEEMKNNMNHFSEIMKKIEELKESGYLEKVKKLNDLLLADITKNPESKEIQNLIKETIKITDEVYKFINMTLPVNYWNVMIEKYLNDKPLIQSIDKIYGVGASKFIGEAFQYYFLNNE